MQTIITTLVLSLFFAQSSGQVKKTDREYDELNGPVRIVRIESEELREQSANTKSAARTLDEITAYDVTGRVTEKIQGIGTDCASSRHVFSYDTGGNRTEAIYWGKAVLADDPAHPSASPLLYKQVFKLDKAARRSEVDEYDSAGRLSGKAFYEYDDKGRVKTIHEEDGSTRSHCEFKYNDKGLASEKTCKYTDFRGRDRSQYKYEYDAKGNWVEKSAVSSTVLLNGSVDERARILYREIEYYSSPQDQSQQKEVGERFDITKLVPCPPLIIRKSGGVLQGSALKRVEPSYPREAIAARIGGSVVVEVTVDEWGKVISARSVSGPSELRGASVEAARLWEFRPTTLSRNPVKVIGTITFNYNL